MAAKKIKNYFVNPQNKFDYTRNAFHYERTHSTNIDTGVIVPVGFINCLPGTTVPNKFGFILQSAPLLGPSLDNVYIDIISVFCPTRLVMADFNEWLGDNDTYAWTLGNNVHYPKIRTLWTQHNSNNKNQSHTYIASHYLGPHIGFRFSGSDGVGYNSMHTNVFYPSESIFYNGINVIPSRMYDLIWNELFRNENIQAPILFSKQSGTDLSLDITNYQNCLGSLHRANRLKNVFNMARLGPAIQTVDLGLGNNLPLVTGSGYAITQPAFYATGLTGSGHLAYDSSANNHQLLADPVSGPGTGSQAVNATNIYADLSALTVNSMYYAIMMQKYLNKASSGRRPVEFYKTMFGISRSDAAYDVPELLSQKRFKVNISRVIATSNSNDSQNNMQSLGTQGAFSLTSANGTLFPEFTATEYGMLWVFAVIRTQESLSSGIDKYLADHELLSTYLPVFDHIGEEAIEFGEISNSTYLGNQRIFGYQEAWYRYRYTINDAVGVFRPGSPLDFMTFNRSFSAGAGVFTVNNAYIQASPKDFDRILQLPLYYTASGLDYDPDGQPYTQTRYQWVIQFALVGDLIETISKDSEPLLFGSRI